MLLFIALMIALLYLELVIVQSTAPGLVDDIGSATFIGLAIGRLVPVPGGGGSGLRFGSENNDGGIDNGSNDDADDGDSGH
jgi:hypothetical protein